MKRLLIITTLIFLILAKILKPDTENCYYPETAVVVEICEDEVIVETYTGNLFGFYGSEDWFIGDIASLIIDDCGTSTVEDDIIITAKYSGVWKKIRGIRND